MAKGKIWEMLKPMKIHGLQRLKNPIKGEFYLFYKEKTHGE